MDKLTADVDFLYELGELRQIRRYFHYAGPYSSSVSEHTLRVAFTALILAKKAKADVAKVLQIAMIHDVPEIRTGDAHPWQKPYVKMDVHAAAADMLSQTSLAGMVELIEDYEKRESLESQLVKDADMIECELEMREHKESGVSYVDYFEEAGHNEGILQKLRTDAGRELYEAVSKRRPLDRCLVAKSSHNSGKHGK